MLSYVNSTANVNTPISITNDTQIHMQGYTCSQTHTHTHTHSMSLFYSHLLQPLHLLLSLTGYNTSSEAIKFHTVLEDDIRLVINMHHPTHTSHTQPSYTMTTHLTNKHCNDMEILIHVPTLLAMLAWAPPSSRSLAISTCPLPDASISGVSPSCYKRITYKCTMKDIHYQPTLSSLYTLTTHV